ncbi:MAG: condensation domain-containing protein [Bacteroidota bacterium]
MNTTAKYPITLMINDDGGVFNFQLQYSSSYFTKADVDNLIEQFKNLLQKIADTPDADIIDILGNGSIQENRHHEEMSFDF